MALVNRKWLTDDVINAAQTLLKRAYPNIGGLQDTALAEILAFGVQRGEFVQVFELIWMSLDHSIQHWLQVLVRERIRQHSQLLCVNAHERANCSMLFSEDKELILEYQAVQSQRGSNDCGLFALAFATSLCAGENPVEINYIQHLLRKHLLDCITHQVISPFPIYDIQEKEAITTFWTHNLQDILQIQAT